MSTIPPLQASPCENWIDGQDVLDHGGCGDLYSNAADLEDAAAIASGILYEASGRKYPGLCEISVRPCASTSCGCFPQLIAPATWVWSGGRWCEEAQGVQCGCGVEQRIKLAPWPVRAITEVTIGTDTVDPLTYRLDQHRYITRVRGNGGWPRCQDFEANPGDAGSFVITFTWGIEPPMLGAEAAVQLACEIAKATNVDPAIQAQCVLPSNVRQVVRQGTTYQIDPNKPPDLIGMDLVTAFLEAYGSTVKRRSAIWSPAKALQYPRRSAP